MATLSGRTPQNPPDAATTPPPRVGQAVFDADNFAAAMRTAKAYDASCNLFWLNLMWSPCPGVPINRSAVDMLRRVYFSKPARFPLPVVVAVAGGGMTADEFNKAKGNLRRVSPDEIEHAFLLAVADAVIRGDPEEELLRGAWQLHCNGPPLHVQ